ncbi:MAG: DUF1178 family protein [Comamonadaceae bacterium]|nr:MAG: DUF1178 family protein [Comamonadaceae bacterium]
MKVLGLRCAHQHDFEGWFASGEAFEAQLAAGQVACPVCDSREITKLLSAPRLNLGSVREPAGEGASPPAASGELVPDSPQARWLQAVRKVMSETEDVGERFATEARRMHYGEIEERGIRGQVSREETESLLDEGIAVHPLLVPPALKETLQ